MLPYNEDKDLDPKWLWILAVIMAIAIGLVVYMIKDTWAWNCYF